jgi:hypothetical protein
MGHNAYWEAKISPTSQKIPQISCKAEVHYVIHMFPATVHMLSQIDAVHTLSFHFLNIHLNNILQYMSGLPSGVHPSGFLTNHLYGPLSPKSTLSLGHLILLDLITRKIMDELYRSLSSSLCSFLHSSVSSPPFKHIYSPQHSIVKHPKSTILTQYERPSFTPV